MAQLATEPSVEAGLVHRLRVDEAALALQLKSRQGSVRTKDLLVTGPCEKLNTFALATTVRAREIIAVAARCSPVEELRPVPRADRRLLHDGVRMTVLIETRALSRPALELFAEADDLPYRVGYAPLQVRILDRARVMLDGPSRDGMPTILLTEDHEVVRAAFRYAECVRQGSRGVIDHLAAVDSPGMPAAGEPATAPTLSRRQRLIAELLDGGGTDADIAGALEVSVRTVRYEVARILDVLGARSRFAAGRRYAAVADDAVA